MSGVLLWFGGLLIGLVIGLDWSKRGEGRSIVIRRPVSRQTTEDVVDLRAWRTFRGGAA